MGALPKRKISHHRQGRRRAAGRRRPLQLTPCPHCQAPRQPHLVCPSCGRYR